MRPRPRAAPLPLLLPLLVFLAARARAWDASMTSLAGKLGGAFEVQGIQRGSLRGTPPLVINVWPFLGATAAGWEALNNDSSPAPWLDAVQAVRRTAACRRQPRCWPVVAAAAVRCRRAAPAAAAGRILTPIPHPLPCPHHHPRELRRWAITARTRPPSAAGAWATAATPTRRGRCGPAGGAARGRRRRPPAAVRAVLAALGSAAFGEPAGTRPLARPQVSLDALIMRGDTMEAGGLQCVNCGVTPWKQAGCSMRGDTMEAGGLLQVDRAHAGRPRAVRHSRFLPVCAPGGRSPCSGAGRLSPAAVLGAVAPTHRHWLAHAHLPAGAVAYLRNVRNAISAARLVMEHTQHSLLAGEAAALFAEEMGLPLEGLDTRRSTRAWQQRYALLRTGRAGAVGSSSHEAEGRQKFVKKIHGTQPYGAASRRQRTPVHAFQQLQGRAKLHAQLEAERGAGRRLRPLHAPAPHR